VRANRIYHNADDSGRSVAYGVRIASHELGVNYGVIDVGGYGMGGPKTAVPTNKARTLEILIKKPLIAALARNKGVTLRVDEIEYKKFLVVSRTGLAKDDMAYHQPVHEAVNEIIALFERGTLW